LLYFSNINYFSTKQLNTLYVDYMHFTIKSTIGDTFQKRYSYSHWGIIIVLHSGKTCRS
jgi:hypothetical protein